MDCTDTAHEAQLADFAAVEVDVSVVGPNQGVL